MVSLAEFLKGWPTKKELETYGMFRDIIVAVWRGGGVPQQWKYATIEVLHKTNKIGQSVASIAASPSWLTQGTYSSNSSQITLVTTSNTKTFCRRNSVDSDSDNRWLT